MDENFEEGPKTNTTHAAFAALLDPLEQVTGRRLGNPARGDCFKEFQRRPGAVRRVAEDALVDATRNPVGLFSHRIKHGWHELEPVPPPEREREPTPLAAFVVANCVGCGQERLCSDYGSGRVLCQDCG